MCGISGAIGFDSSQGASIIQKMNERLQHRGPDDEGFFVENKVAFGHRRLAILDLSSAGHQPMTSPNGRYIIVYNGEIYNFREIRNKIKKDFPAYTFISDCDTEVLLAAFECWGKDCLKEFNGMFAFAIWDKREEVMFAARDRAGIKPFYYYKADNKLLFASEIRSVLDSGIVPRIADKNSVADYLNYQTVHAPQTIIKDVYMLMPGHYMFFDNGKIEIEEYWSFTKNYNKDLEGKDYRKICKDVSHLLYESVQRRMISDVPFGAFLSGGIDSSAITGLMSEVSPGKVKTFSIVFEDKKFSEEEYARLISKKFGTEHHELKLSPEFFLENLTIGLKAMDHPSLDGLNTFMVSKMTKESGITMALSGVGGDELFCGYDVFKRSFLFEKNRFLWKMPSFFRRMTAGAFQTLRPSVSSQKVAKILSSNGKLEETYPVSREFFSVDSLMKFFNESFTVENGVKRVLKNLELNDLRLPFLSKVSIAELSTYLQNVLLRDTDQMSMAHALEVRVPFLDHTIIEYVLGVKDSFKYPNLPKKLLVDSLGNLLPREIIDRPKMGFVFPWENWLKRELSSFCQNYISSLSETDIFNNDSLQNFWTAFLRGDRTVHWSRIWVFVVLSFWLKENDVKIG